MTYQVLPIFIILCILIFRLRDVSNFLLRTKSFFIERVKSIPLIIGVSVSIVLVIIAIPLYYYLISREVSSNINFFFSLIGFIANVWTTIIAILLYDRYGLKGIKKERELDAVIVFANKVKKLGLTITKGNSFYRIGFSKLNISSLQNFARERGDLGKELYINETNYENFFADLQTVKDQTLLPREIKDCCKFLEYVAIEDVISSSDEDLRLRFGSLPPNSSFYRAIPRQTFEQFLDNYSSLLLAVEDWLGKTQSDIDLGLS